MEKREVNQHGVRGAYVGGDWVPIEECAEKFNISHGSNCGGDCSTCPRSRSRHSAVKSDGTYDVVIIGAGCIGASIARELIKNKLSVLLLEAADDVTQGATKGNSGIVHAGFDDVPGTNRARFCWPGNQMFPKLDEELHFGYQRNGSLVLARGPEDEKHLEELKARGEKNGVKRLRIVGREELLKLEPYINPEVTAALLAPDAGNLIPYEFAIALAENAVDNGVELRIRREVTNITQRGGADSPFTVTARHWEPKAYLDAVAQSPEKKSGIPLLSVLIRSTCAGIGVALILLRVALPVMAAKVPALAATFTEFEEMLIPGLIVLFNVVGVLLSKASSSSSSSTASGAGRASAFDTPPVGEGGEKVSVEAMKMGGSGSASAVQGETVSLEEFTCRFVVNAAGGYADKIAHMLGDDSFKIKPRLGDYLLLNRSQGYLSTHTLFPCPGPLGKGVLVQTTLWGNLILGPTARDVHVAEHMAESISDVTRFILTRCHELVPHFDVKEVIHAFCGARAKSSRGDWIIEPCSTAPRCIHAAGIDSPGLAGSPAVALEIVALLKKAGLEMVPNPNFNPNRAPIIVPKDGWKGIKAGPVGKYTNPKENVVCKCEKVTEAEIVDAIHRSLPIDSTQAIRKRTRAGMGHCQADPENYNCECRVADIIARETGLPPAAITRRPWPATSSLRKRWLDDEGKIEIESLTR